MQAEQGRRLCPRPHDIRCQVPVLSPRAHQGYFVLVHVLERSKVVGPVTGYRPAQGEAKMRARIVRVFERQRLARAQGFVTNEHKHRCKPEIVGAALGDDRKTAGGGATNLGIKPLADHAKLPDRILAQS